MGLAVEESRELFALKVPPGTTDGTRWIVLRRGWAGGGFIHASYGNLTVNLHWEQGRKKEQEKAWLPKHGCKPGDGDILYTSMAAVPKQCSWFSGCQLPPVVEGTTISWTPGDI